MPIHTSSREERTTLCEAKKGTELKAETMRCMTGNPERPNGTSWRDGQDFAELNIRSCPTGSDFDQLRRLSPNGEA